MPTGEERYTIDRWKCLKNTALYIRDGYIEIAPQASSGRGMTQLINNPSAFAGKTLTAAVKVKNVTTGSGLYINDGSQKGIAITETGVYTVTKEIAPDPTSILVQIGSSGTTDAERVGIEWIALYEGEYTAATLPEYQPKGYWAELAECQRYYIRWNSYKKLGIAVPYATDKCVGYVFVPEMRTTPSFNFKNITLGSDERPVSAFVFSQMSPNMVELSITQSGPGMTIGNTTTIRPTAGGYCEFIADL